MLLFFKLQNGRMPVSITNHLNDSFFEGFYIGFGDNEAEYSQETTRGEAVRHYYNCKVYKQNNGENEPCTNEEKLAKINVFFTANGLEEITTAEVLNECKSAKSTELSQAIQSYIFAYYDSGEQASLLRLQISGSAEQKEKIDIVWSWIFNTVQIDYATRKQAIADASTFAELDAVSLDFSNNDTSKPAYSYSDIAFED